MARRSRATAVAPKPAPWGDLPAELWHRIICEHEEYSPDFPIKDSTMNLFCIKSLIQISAVSRMTAAAACSILASSGGLHLQGHSPAWLPSRLDSALFLRWAPLVRSLELGTLSYSLPGLSAFLKAASSLTLLELDCPDPMAAVQADQVLQQCSQVNHVRINGSHMPSHYPPAMEMLEADISSAGSDWKWQQLCALPYRLIQHKALSHLVCTFHGPHALLACPIQLGQLGVTMRMELVDNMHIDLSWLRHQPLTELSIHITIRTAGLEAHQAVIAELQHLPIFELGLTLWTSLPADVQELWKAVAVSGSCKVICYRSVAQTASTALLALPCCPRIFLTTPMSGKGQLYVRWAAVIKAASFEALLGPDRELCIINGDELPTGPDAQPRQLVVHAAHAVHGLRHAQLAGGNLLLQNAAARLAAWTADAFLDDDDCDVLRKHELHVQASS